MNHLPAKRAPRKLRAIGTHTETCPHCGKTFETSIIETKEENAPILARRILQIHIKRNH